MSSYNAATGVWKDKSSHAGGRNVTMSRVSPSSSPSYMLGSSCALDYLVGKTYSDIVFNMPRLVEPPASFCTVSRYTGPAYRRIFQRSGLGVDWLHGHWNGNAGVAYYNGWIVGEGGTVPLTNWVYEWCVLVVASRLLVLTCARCPPCLPQHVDDCQSQAHLGDGERQTVFWRRSGNQDALGGQRDARHQPRQWRDQRLRRHGAHRVEPHAQLRRAVAGVQESGSQVLFRFDDAGAAASEPTTSAISAASAA
jgi:hypothetical protein